MDDLRFLLDENDRLRALIRRLIEVYAPPERKLVLLKELEK
jgi:hypothetical protein